MKGLAMEMTERTEVRAPGDVERAPAKEAVGKGTQSSTAFSIVLCSEQELLTAGSREKAYCEFIPHPIQ